MHASSRASGDRILADGDEVIFRGWCEREGAARIGFGECRGAIRAAFRSEKRSERHGGRGWIWSDMLVSGVPLAEKVIRTMAVYVFLVGGLRLFGKRELGQLNPLDFIVLLLLSNTVQNAIIGNDNSLVGGLTGRAGADDRQRRARAIHLQAIPNCGDASKAAPRNWSRTGTRSVARSQHNQITREEFDLRRDESRGSNTCPTSPARDSK